MPRTSPRICVLPLALGLVFAAFPGNAVDLTLAPFASGLVDPICVSHAGDGSGRLFVCQQTGAVRVVDAGGTVLPTPLVTPPAVLSGGERGLLGLAFHPEFSSNGHFYVHYSTAGGSANHLSVIARYTISQADPNVADPASRLTVLTWPQDFSNHNGGQLAFGPDGYLYIALGDGGSGGDPLDRAQSLDTLLGKILRIDVDGDDFPADPERNYRVPPDNPFVEAPVDDPATLGEIWAWGLRNPWRFSFDRCAGDLFIGDVGQNVWEEVDFEPAGSPGGVNYGWNPCEGSHPYGGSGAICDSTAGGFQPPILEYSHSQFPAFACSVTGGYRYRGSEHPDLVGRYLFADYCSGYIWTAIEAAGLWSFSLGVDAPFNITTFGEDERGELYVADYNGGVLYRLGTDSGGIFGNGFECVGDASAWSATVPGR